MTKCIDICFLVPQLSAAPLLIKHVFISSGPRRDGTAQSPATHVPRASSASSISASTFLLVNIRSSPPLPFSRSLRMLAILR